MKNWKDFTERDAFEKKLKTHKQRFKNWPCCKKLGRALSLFGLQILIIVSFYGSCAYLMITEELGYV